MGDMPSNLDSSREAPQNLQNPQRPERRRGTRNLGAIGRYVRGAYIDPSSNVFDYGLFVVTVVVALLIARTWHSSGGTVSIPPPAPAAVSGPASSDRASGSPPSNESTVPLPASGAGSLAAPIERPLGSTAAGASDRSSTGDLQGEDSLPAAKRPKTAPKLIHQEYAKYTDQARFARFSGRIIAVFTVDEEGLPQNIELAAVAPFGLGERAIAAVRKWRYKPATEHGRPISAKVVEEVPFR